MNVLIIDDDPIARKAISHYLLESGHTVTAASNGKEAIDYITAGNRPDAIMVDLIMPELSGPSFLIKLKRLIKDNMPKIIVVSGILGGENFLHKLDASYDYFLAKPVSPAQLEDLLKKIVPNNT